MATKKALHSALNKYSDFANGFVNAFTWKAVLDLGIIDILSKGGGQLTLDEIAAQLPSKTVDVGHLDRIMTFAALNELFTEVSLGKEGGAAQQLGQKQFCLTPLSLLMVQQEDGTNSFFNTAKFLLSKTSVESFMSFSESVLSGAPPFEIAHGKYIWDYLKTHPDMDRSYNQMQASRNSRIAMSVIQAYLGFEGVKVLVDVGGGTGTMLASITKAYPSIRAINFDQPHVIASAPEIPGVTHVAGDMFEKVPEGDGILMKYILHDWNDKESVEILKNCHQALTEAGKIIIVERVLPEPRVLDDGAKQDMIMLAFHSTGRERTAREWQQILKDGGFPRMEVIPTTCECCAIEGYKF